MIRPDLRKPKKLKKDEHWCTQIIPSTRLATIPKIVASVLVVNERFRENAAEETAYYFDKFSENLGGMVGVDSSATDRMVIRVLSGNIEQVISLEAEKRWRINRRATE